MKTVDYMQLAERMAHRAIGSTYPNPPVGAVIVKDKTIIARGWTQRNGSPHAEVHAINQIRNKKQLEGASIYTTLEPCSHVGKNPPCVDKIIKYKFSKVFISEIDKNALVKGKSIKKLRKRKIKVIVKNFGYQTRHINRVFFNSLNKNLPYITLKIASTADGKIATKLRKSKWITNSVSRQHGHMLRAQNDCILVGKGTIIEDNPSLDCRLSGLESLSPDLFILDSNLNIPSNYKIYNNHSRNVFVFYSDEKKLSNINNKNIKYIKVSKKGSELPLKVILNKIANLGYMRILVEGGSHLSGSLIKNNYVDEIQWFRASKIIGKGGVDAVSDMGISSMESTKNYVLLESKNYENDILTIYRKE